MPHLLVYISSATLNQNTYEMDAQLSYVGQTIVRLNLPVNTLDGSIASINNAIKSAAETAAFNSMGITLQGGEKVVLIGGAI